MKKTIYTLTLTAFIMAATNLAFASEPENNFNTVNALKVDTLAAVKKAESDLNGKVTRIELEIDHKRPVYEIEVVNKDKTYDLSMDANTGAIIDKEVDHED